MRRYIQQAGQAGVPGAPGNLGYLAQLPPPINTEAHRDQMRQNKIYNRGKRTDNPNEADAFLRRTGPQLPPMVDNFGSAEGLFSQLPGGEQGPAQGPNTPVRNYPGMGYGPVGPMGGGLPPTPMASMYRGPQNGQMDQFPATAAGFQTKYVS